ncbi:MAG TPA: hypothetical protein VGL58_12975 [Caulobacteraceae bacterium]|jgi:hypothetical protein
MADEEPPSRRVSGKIVVLWIVAGVVAWVLLTVAVGWLVAGTGGR